MCISHNPGIDLIRIQAVFKYKEDQMEQPEIYLGDQVKNMIVYGEFWLVHVCVEVC